MIQERRARSRPFYYFLRSVDNIVSLSRFISQDWLDRNGVLQVQSERLPSLEIWKICGILRVRVRVCRVVVISLSNSSSDSRTRKGRSRSLSFISRAFVISPSLCSPGVISLDREGCFHEARPWVNRLSCWITARYRRGVVASFGVRGSPRDSVISAHRSWRVVAMGQRERE